MRNLGLTEEEKQDLKLPLEGLSAGIYCQQCGKCISQCSKELDIPSAMRSYMYAYGYKNLAHAQQTLRNANLPQYPCSDCTTCQIDCTMGFDIKNKITDINRLSKVPDDFLVSPVS